MWNYILQTNFLKHTTKANAKEKAHLQTAKPAPKATSAKELFPSPFSPPPKNNKFTTAQTQKSKPGKQIAQHITRVSQERG